MTSSLFLRRLLFVGAWLLAPAALLAQRAVTLSVAGNQITSTGSATVVLASQGNENALGFSVTFDPAVLRFDTTASGADLSGATLNVNTSQAGSGRVGVALALPSGASFAAGNRSLVVLNFTVLTAAGSTALGFGNQPVFREISDATANELTATFTNLSMAANTASVAPVMTTHPVGQAVNAGANATFTAAASGSPTPTYQWKKDGVALAGQTTATLTLSGVTAANAGSYTVVATNSGGSVTSNAAVLTVTTPQRTVTLAVPANQMTGTGAATVVLASQGNENALGFSVTFDPAVLRFDTTASGADLSGATLNVNTSQAGSGRVGVALALPSGASFAAGNRSLVVLNFTVLAAAGSTALGFGDQPVFREISDATANELTATFTNLSMAANTTSVAPVMTTHPAGQAVNAGANVTFTAAASGSPTPTYQWKKDGGVLAGQTTATLTLSGVTAANAGSYTVVATNSGGSVTSNAAVLTVTTLQRSVALVVASNQITGTGAVTLMLASLGNENALGGTVTFDPAVLRFDSSANGADLGGASLNVNPNFAGTGKVGVALSLPSGSTFAAGNRSLVVLNFTALASAGASALGFGDTPVVREISDAAANTLTGTFTGLSVGVTSTATAPSITTQPVNQTITAGQSGAVSVVAAGTAPLAYQWRKNNVAIAGATNATYNFSNAQAADAGTYTVVVTNAAGSVTSSPITITIQVPPLITSANSATFATNQARTFTVVASGFPAPTFSVTSGALPAWATLNATTGVLAGTPTTATGSPFVFTITANNGIAPAATQGFTLTVQAATLPTITAQPVSRSAAVGANVNFAVTAVGTAPLTYQWRKNGTAISGATAATLALSNVQTADTAAYTVVITNLAGSVTSEVATLGVIPVGTSATHAAVGTGYVAGNTVTITNTFTFTGGATSLAWRVLLPAGWSFLAGSASQGEVKPEIGTLDLLEWAWSTPPASPLTFTYTLNVPAGQTGPKDIVALAVLRQGAAPIELLATPDPLVIDRVGTHSADTNRDFRIGLIELTRVIELYNTRIGTTRTGAYRVQDGTEDGFAPDPARTAGSVVALAKYHSGDSPPTGAGSPPDGSIGLVELTRVIELYNARSGTVRTGAYHAQAGTEDGFSPGP